MTLKIPPPPSPNSDFNDFTWKDWFRILRDQLVNTGVGAWSALNFAGSNITDIETRRHNDLQNIQGGGASEKYHLTAQAYDPCSRMSWNTDMGTANLTMGYSGAINQIGQETYYPPVQNNTGSTFSNGKVAAFSGVSSGNPTITGFLADGSMPPEYIMGVATSDIDNGDKGFITQFGYVNDVDTTGTPYGETWAVGDILYASPTTAGGLTKVKPTVPNLAITVAAVVVANATTGRMLVRCIPQPRLYYGTFQDTTTQSIATINTAQAVTFNTTTTSSGVSRGTPTSRLVVANSGQYEFSFSLQVTSSTSSTKNIYIWARKNGTDISATTRQVTIAGNSEIIVPAWSYQVSMNANDYFELMWAADSTAVSITPASSTAFCPSTGSALMSVTQVNQ